jgi:hypothetical protein
MPSPVDNNCQIKLTYCVGFDRAMPMPDFMCVHNVNVLSTMRTFLSHQLISSLRFLGFGATGEGWRRAPRGMVANSYNFRARSLKMIPGATAFTAMPEGPSSRTRCLIRPGNPVFAALYRITSQTPGVVVLMFRKVMEFGGGDVLFQIRFLLFLRNQPRQHHPFQGTAGFDDLFQRPVGHTQHVPDLTGDVIEIQLQDIDSPCPIMGNTAAWLSVDPQFCVLLEEDDA